MVSPREPKGGGAHHKKYTKKGAIQLKPH